VILVIFDAAVVVVVGGGKTDNDADNNRGVIEVGDGSVTLMSSADRYVQFL
jgi:hypothetical protein